MIFVELYHERATEGFAARLKDDPVVRVRLRSGVECPIVFRIREEAASQSYGLKWELY